MLIEVRDLTYTYPRRNSPAVDGISFEVEDGEIFGFLGPSGAGKSTTQKVLTGLLPDYRGSASVFGDEVSSNGRSFYERIGVSFEFPNVYTRLTARENLEFFAGLYEDETVSPDDLLEMVGLSEDADHRVSTFSKGMKMRLNLCRAFLNNPDLVFLDEPTSGQDPANARKIRELVGENRDAGKTFFVTTHDMVTASVLCDRVAFIVDGKIDLIDSPRQLMIEHGRPLVRVEYGDGKSAEFDLEDIGTNESFLDLIREGQIETIHSLEASLEDIFVKVTGRELA